MKLSDFKLGMKVVKVGGDAIGTIAVVIDINLEEECVTVEILKTADVNFVCRGEELFVYNNPENWQPVVTQLRNK